MPPALNLTVTYCTPDDLNPLLSEEGVTGRLDDDDDGSIDANEQGYLATAIQWASDKVNFYCLNRYAALDLANSWLVNNWAVLCAGHWLSIRRGNPSPASIADLYKEALKDMEMIRTGAANLPGIGLRTAAWPAWSNIRLDQLYSLRKLRVERPISEQSPVKDYYQQIDWPSQFILEP